MWDYKQIRTNVRKTVFSRGFRAWLGLAAVCFIFSFLGAGDGGQTDFLGEVDRAMDTELGVFQNNMEVINTYIAGRFANTRIFRSELVSVLVNSLSQEYSWFINLMAANFAYFQRNSGEVIAWLVITGFILGVIRLFVQNVFEIGKYRYVMESRFQRQTSLKRVFAPFHKKYLANEIGVMVMYRLTLLLWLFTIVGYPIKWYSYRFIPYLLAENPRIKWREAKKLSASMTKGVKWKMFLTDVSYFYIHLLKLLPFAGILVSLPIQETLAAEMYFCLREKMSDRQFFMEQAFDQPPYVLSGEACDEFVLKDTVVPVSMLRDGIAEEVRQFYTEYKLCDYIMFFFSFSFIGWVWEVLVLVVCEHALVNRGTMYGPLLPIYGIGGVVMIFLLGRFKNHEGRVFALGMLICGVIEYSGSWFLDYFNNASYWDYKSKLINVNGRICLEGLVLFGLGGLFGVYIAAPRISAYIARWGQRKRTVICTLLVALFVADLCFIAIFGFNSGENVGDAYATIENFTNAVERFANMA